MKNRTCNTVIQKPESNLPKFRDISVYTSFIFDSSLEKPNPCVYFKIGTNLSMHQAGRDTYGVDPERRVIPVEIKETTIVIPKEYQK